MSEEQIKFEQMLDDFYESSKERSRTNTVGAARSVFQGLTFGFGDELEALYKSGKKDTNYDEELEQIRDEHGKYTTLNPGVSTAAEVAGAIPTVALGGILSKAGVSVATQGAIEGAIYGVGTGETAEQRLVQGLTGGALGYGVGKLVDVAITGKITNKDIDADLSQSTSTKLSSPLDTETPYNAFIDQDVLDVEKYTPVADPAFRRKPLSEAATAGELFEGVKASVRQFYNDKMRGVSDTLWAEVAPEVGARYQRASETALRENAKALARFGDRLVPAIKAINENADAKGAMLDYAAGYLGKGAQGRDKLRSELSSVLTSDQMKSIDEYLDFSNSANTRLNKEVFAASFDPNKTYLHTRLNKEQLSALKKQNNLTDEQLEDLLDDPAFKTRTRGKYLNSKDPSRPNPMDYDNPIVSDMQRIFKMEQLAQLKRVYGVDVDYVSSQLNKSLSPSEFMDALAITLKNKGLQDDAVTFARKLMVDDIMGQNKTAHPIVQALSSVAYATTLAGPMSAVLNVADIPLVGAKYGGRAVMSGAGALKPMKFKSVPNVDLKTAGLNNQHFGEFVSLINSELKDTAGFAQKVATSFRKGTDMLMKGSGFAAMDQVGKKGVMRGVLKSAADDAQAGKLADNWGFYFNEKELDIIQDQLSKHGDDWTKYEGRGAALIEELMFAGLGQQQLISSAGRPAAWSRNPNLRPLWALRGFVIKQQSLALREVVGNIKAGKPEEAAKFLGRYAAYGAGGYAVINEGRQFIFGDGDVSAGGLVRGYGDAWASLLTANTLGLNDYQFGKIKQNGLMLTFAEGSTPIAIDRPLDIGSRTIDVIDQKRYGRELLLDTFPAIKQPARMIRNIDELTGGMLGPIGESAETLLERKPKE